MSKTQPECQTCPMDEVRPGFYRCKKCGYEKKYRNYLYAEQRFYIGCGIMLATMLAVLPCAYQQRNMPVALALVGLGFVELIATFAWMWKAK